MILIQFCKRADTSFPWQMQHWLSSCEDGPGLWVHLPEQRRGQWSQCERCPHHWWQRLHTPPSQPGPHRQGNESHQRSAGQKYCLNCVPCKGRKKNQEAIHFQHNLFLLDQVIMNKWCKLWHNITKYSIFAINLTTIEYFTLVLYMSGDTHMHTHTYAHTHTHTHTLTFCH